MSENTRSAAYERLRAERDQLREDLTARVAAFDAALRRVEAVVKAAREWATAQDNDDPKIDALLDALAALDPTEAPR